MEQDNLEQERQKRHAAMQQKSLADEKRIAEDKRKREEAKKCLKAEMKYMDVDMRKGMEAQSRFGEDLRKTDVCGAGSI